MNLQHILDSARAAYRMGCTGYLSTGESLAAAVVLDRADWLKERGYSMAEAISRVADSRPTDSVIRDLAEASRVIQTEIACDALLQEGEG